MNAMDDAKVIWTWAGVRFRLCRKKMGKYRMDIPAASPPSISADETNMGTTRAEGMQKKSFCSIASL